MIQKVKPKNLVINDIEITMFMISNSVNHIRFVVEENSDGYISAKFPDYENMLVIEKHWMKVHYGPRATSIRTPSFLKYYKGKDIEIYRDESDDDFELFRIRPIKFWPESLLIGKYKRTKLNTPYFTRSNCLVITKDFIKENNNDLLLFSKISFDTVDQHIIDSGVIFARFVRGNHRNVLSYSLKDYGNNLRTTTLVKLMDMLHDSGKKITDFQYRGIVHDENRGYDLIAFEEEVYGES